MLRATFDGQPPGTVFDKSRPHSIRVAGVAESLHPLTRIEIVVNGEVARTLVPQNTRLDDRPGVASGVATAFDEQVPIAHSSWVAVRCFKESPGTPANPGGAGTRRFRYAHTAPAHFEVDGPVRPRRREVDYFIRRMEEEIARNREVLAKDEVAEYERALEIYRRIAERARP